MKPVSTERGTWLAIAAVIVALVGVGVVIGTALAAGWRVMVAVFVTAWLSHLYHEAKGGR